MDEVFFYLKQEGVTNIVVAGGKLNIDRISYLFKNSFYPPRKIKNQHIVCRYKEVLKASFRK